jgi:hypothetical protein
VLIAVAVPGAVALAAIAAGVRLYVTRRRRRRDT